MSVPEGSDTSVSPAASGLATTELGHEVTRLVRATHALRAQVHQGSRDGLEWAGYQLLLHLCKDGPQRSSALAAASCIDPSTVSRQVGELVARGLVERRADPHDGRATLLAATELGQARHDVAHHRRAQAFAHLLVDWSEDDVRTLTSLLRRLTTDVYDRRDSLVEALSTDSENT